MDGGVRTSCEDRRLAIRSLAGRLLNAVERPLAGREAVRFMAAETDEERKMIVHQIESGIRCKWEQVYQATKRRPDAGPDWQEAIGGLTENRLPVEFRASCWDLDRIYYYLLIDYFAAAALRWRKVPPAESAAEGRAAAVVETMPQDILCAARDVEIEVERYRARSKGGSLIPLNYALIGLRTLCKNTAGRSDAEFEKAAGNVRAAVHVVQEEFADLLQSDTGRALARLLREVEAYGGQMQRGAAV